MKQRIVNEKKEISVHEGVRSDKKKRYIYLLENVEIKYNEMQSGK